MRRNKITRKSKSLIDEKIFKQSFEIALAESGKEIGEISEITKISPRNIKKILDADFSFPSRVVLESTVKSLSKFFELKTDPFVEFALSRAKIPSNSKFQTKTTYKETQGVLLPRVLIVFFSLVFFSLAVFFVGRQLISFSAKPEIDIFYPEDGMVVEDKILEVSGKSDKADKISVNGILVEIGENGEFERNIRMKEGVNTIGIVAESQLGRKSEKIIRVIFKEGEAEVEEEIIVAEDLNEEEANPETNSV